MECAVFAFLEMFSAGILGDIFGISSAYDIEAAAFFAVQRTRICTENGVVWLKSGAELSSPTAVYPRYHGCATGH